MSEPVRDPVPDDGGESEGARRRVRRSWRMPAAVFAGVLVAGVLLGLGTSPFSGYDEYRHFAHAWQVSDGRVFPLDHRTASGARVQGGYLPSGVVRDMNSLFAVGRSHDPAGVFDRFGDRAGGGHREFLEFSNVASYSVVSYLPAAIAIRIGRLFGASTLALLAIARLFGLIAYAALAALAVWRIPTRKGLMAVLCLTPVAIAQAATVSADGITIGLSLLVVAEALRLAAQPPGAVTRGGCIEAGVALIALALAKPPYVLFGLLYVVAIARQRGVAGKVLGGAMAAAAALAAGWNAWASSHYVQQYVVPAQFATKLYAYRGVDSSRQLKLVALHPRWFVGIIGHTLARYGGEMTRDIVLQSAAWQAPLLLTVLELAVLIGVVVVTVDACDISRVRAIGAVTAVLTAYAVFVLAYAGWNKYEAPRIDALDGRYFFPVLALVALALMPAVGRRWSKATRRTAIRMIFATQFVVAIAFAGAVLRATYIS